MKHELPPLGFPLDALEPEISARTLQLHHGRHHRGYVEQLHRLLPPSGLENEELGTILSRAQGPLYDNAAQHFNHSMYWVCLRPGGAPRPSGDLEQAIRKSFTSVDRLRERFLDEAARLFGSGWCWLVREHDGGLSIQCTPNAKVPIADCTPVLTCDVWEHAYYLDYQNERRRYLEGFWKRINWDEVEQSWREPEIASIVAHFEERVAR